MDPKLPLTVNDITTIDEKYRDLYEKQEDGTHNLAVDLSSIKKEKNKFRDNNVELLKKNEKLEEEVKKYEGVDLEEYKKLREQMEKTKDEKMMSEGKYKELLAGKHKELQDQYSGKIKKLEEQLAQTISERDSHKQSLNRIRVDDAVTKAVAEVGVLKPNALADVLSRAALIWRVGEDGELVAKNPDGTEVYSKDSADPMTLKEWSKNLFGEANHLFEANKGGSAGGSGQNRPGTKFIDRGDIIHNIEGVAKGDVEVRPNVGN